MTELERISALTINDCFFEILHRLVDFSEVPEGESHYELSEEELSLYERLTLHVSLEKPSLEAMEADLITYKAELTAAEEARLVEVARKADLADRFNALSDINAAYGELGHFAGQPNTAIWLKDLLVNEDHEAAEAAMVALEARDTEVSAARSAVAYKEEREKEYEKEGVTKSEMIVALWEKVIEDRPESADALQTKRQAVKVKIPKP